jgi:hypothetical protein
MKHRLLKSVIRPIAACAGVVALCSAVAFAQGAGVPASQSQSTAQGQPAAQLSQRTDGQIEMDVVHALDASATLKNDLITAATIQGEVTLSGTVSSEASKELAGSIAASISGVTKVHNNLKVGNPSADTGSIQPAPDTEEMPNSAQPQTQQGSAGLPPAEPAPYPGANQPQNESQPPAAAPYPQEGGYPSYPQQRPQYQNPQYSQYPPQNGQQYGSGPAEPQYTPASGPVTLPAGTLIQLRTSESVDSRQAQPGQPVQFVVIQDVTMGGVLAIPRGAVMHGVVTDSQNAGSGKMAGSSSLALTLTSLDLGGRNYPLHTDQFTVKGPNKVGQTVGGALAGGLIGTMIGCIAGRGVGCAIGAGAGAAAGTAAGTAAPGARAWIPSEALVTFHLADPLTVQPVSPQEAQRLAQGLYPGGPTLYRRHNPYYASPYAGYGYGYGPVYYGYPAPFYRPYFMMGGMYYWR